MKVLALGAYGDTDRLVVDRAVAQGDDLTAMVRNAAGFTLTGVRVLEGNALNGEDVVHAMDGQDGVVECIGGSASWKRQTLEPEAMANILAAMRKSRTRRLVVVPAMGVNGSLQQAQWWYRSLLVPTFLRGSARDKVAMEALVLGSGVDGSLHGHPC